MKRFYKLFILLFSLIIAFSFTGCDFINNGDGGEGGGKNPYEEYEPSEVGVNYTTANLINSLNKISNVNFNYAERPAKPYSIQEAGSLVDRSIVAIYSPSADGSSYSSAACGVIIDIDDGIDNGANENNIMYVITCHHVVDDMTNIVIYAPDANGRNYGDDDYDYTNYKFTGKIGGTVSGQVDTSGQVSLVGGIKEADIALLRLYIPNETIANSMVKAKVMDTSKYTFSKYEEVFAVGNPTGVLPARASAGIISYVNRTTTIDTIGEMVLTEIDVNTYQGSSGGGLFNMYGELIGITNSGDTSNVGINYAVPIKITNTQSEDNGFAIVVRQLLGTYTKYNYGYVSRPHVKFGFTTLETDSGLIIESVNSSSLAESAGIQAGDTLAGYRINGESGDEFTAVSTNTQLSTALDGLKLGDDLYLKLTRTYSSMFGSKKTTSTIVVSMKTCMFFFANTGVYTGNVA